jgi:hypothetical protein
MVGAPLERIPAAFDRIVDVNKTIDLSLNGRRLIRWIRSACCLSHPQQINSAAIDQVVDRQYLSCHIRPMAVRPLNHPEREPTPWGFLFSDAEEIRSAPSPRRAP